MHPSRANLINSVVLIVVGLLGAWASSFASPTAFIAPGVGLILLLMNGGMKNDNKIISHVIVLLTLLMTLSLFMPLSKQLQGGMDLGLLRVVVMFLSCVIALVVFIRYFIAQRRAK